MTRINKLWGIMRHDASESRHTLYKGSGHGRARRAYHVLKAVFFAQDRKGNYRGQADVW